VCDRVYLVVAGRESREKSSYEFTTFFRDEYPALVGQAFVLVGDMHEAQELAQEALLRTWRRWNELPPLEDPAVWARVVLHRLAVGIWRRRRVVRRWAPIFSLLDESPIISSDHIEVAQAARSLPPRQRRALVLQAIVGLSIDEIATEMDVPASTVRTWLSRARRRMTSLLEIHDPEGSAVGAQCAGQGPGDPAQEPESGEGPESGDLLESGDGQTEQETKGLRR
jgi:RNA polymerase sigma-70 factor, ECF subfamily